jgi:hypothetical protein
MRLVAASLFVSLQVPTFFVARNLFEAVAQTQRRSDNAVRTEVFCEGHNERIIETAGVDRFTIRRLTEAECAFRSGGRETAMAKLPAVRLTITALSTIPAVLSGVVIALWLTNTTLNVQSFMGAIMTSGIWAANAILLVTFAKISRRRGATVIDSARSGACGGLPAILMTTTGMIAGMILSQSPWERVRKQVLPWGGP